LPYQWSHSIDGVLQKCPRQFWFRQIYASYRAKWNSEKRNAYILANVNTVEQWRGNVIHDIIANFVIPFIQENQEIPSKNNIYREADFLAKKRLDFSRQQRYFEEDMTKKKATDSKTGYCYYTVLWEDMFQESISQITVHEALEQIHRSIDNLLSISDILQSLINSSWIAVEASVRYKQSDIPITGRIDLAYLSSSTGKLNLIDWKISQHQNHDYAPQLWLYAYLLSQVDQYTGNGSYIPRAIPHLVTEADKQLYEINLLTAEVIEYEWDERRSREVKERLFKAIRKLRVILDGRSHKKINGAEFSVAKSSQTCIKCPFRAPCQNLST
jgi:hypothetical protein